VCDQSAYDLLRKLVLNRENAGQRSIVVFSPKLHAAGGIDQLRGNTHPPGVAADAPYQKISNAEFAHDLSHIELRTAIAERRMTRDNK
jgi:hypothetical protein